MKARRLYSWLVYSFMFCASILLVAFGGKRPEATPHTEAVWVQKPDGSLQCGEGKPLPLESGEKELRTAGLRVLESKKSQSSQMIMQMCGAPTGAQNAYRIPKAELEKARSLGFQEVPVSQNLQ